ncbi:MAG: hypothetical protein JSV91_02595 [Phycisphaerales bacterium]|nr:MAG: hypothetical protein JSV91_02595 [Phycisphaerales bacterium]
MKRALRTSVGMAVGVAFLAAPCIAEVIEFRDKDEWIAAVGDYTTIDFTGYSQGQQVTDQYADLGVLFTDCCVTYDFSYNLYPNDFWGVDGNWGIHLEFDQPQLWIATDFPGALGFKLFSGGNLVYASVLMFPRPFGGLISDTPFDEVIIWDDFDDNVHVDDLHFGVPAPAALPLISMVFLFIRRRRV